MLALSVRNADKFGESLLRWAEKTEDLTMHVANGLAVELFNEVVQTSPQFSGDFAANWQYSINFINTTFNELNLLDDPRQSSFRMGSHPAINYAKAMNKGRDFGYKLGDTFYISNLAYHDEPYALKIENNQINFRQWAGNRGQTVHHAFATLLPRYTVVNAQQARRLARRKL